MFCGSGEGLRLGPPGVLWETLQEHGVPFNLYVNSENCVGILGIKSSIFLVGVELPKAALFHFVLCFHGEDLEAEPRPGVCLAGGVISSPMAMSSDDEKNKVTDTSG